MSSSIKKFILNYTLAKVENAKQKPCKELI